MAYRESTITNIRLPKTQARALKQRAAQEEKNINSLLQELIFAYLKGPIKRRERRTDRRSIWDFSKMARKTGAHNLASQIDKIVYGEK